MKTSDKIILYLAKSKEMTKTKLAEKLGISRPTLDNRLKDNTFTIGEIIKIKELGIT